MPRDAASDVPQSCRNGFAIARDSQHLASSVRKRFANAIETWHARDMRHVVLALAIAGCTPRVTSDQELCAKASAMYERCEHLTGTKLEQSLTVDRWRGLCRAVMSGEAKHLMPDQRALFDSMDDATRSDLRSEAQCEAQATDCTAYAACSK